jgi:ABC-type bacteriocin/lantibiotic exporter with double-glycine peptidase domain
MVAHRQSTLARCDRILKVEGGRLVPFHSPSPRDEERVACAVTG